MAQPDLFINTFHEWLEANGVTWMPDFGPFAAALDLNALKAGVLELIDFSVELGLDDEKEYLRPGTIAVTNNGPRYGDRPVLLHWNDKHGPCQDCGLPAAFQAVTRYGPDRLCSVCAANHAADGEEIMRIEEEESER